MDYIHERVKSIPVPIKKTTSQDNCKELSLTHILNDPNKMSPRNSFMEKLMKRMDNYYSSSENEIFYCFDK